MDILIRKIQRKGRDIVFKPNSKSGYKFTSESAQPCLTSFQKSCIKTRSQKDRKLGSFWTPDFCYIGTLMVQNGEVSLSEMISDSGAVAMTDFNNYFPSKKHYWYDKAKPQNPAMETYFIGVRAAASVLAYYYNLQTAGEIKEAGVLYNKYLKPLGLARLLADADSNLLSEDDYIYPVNVSARNCIMKAVKTSILSANKNISDTYNKVNSMDKNTKDDNVVGGYVNAIKRESSYSDVEDDVIKTIKAPIIRVQKISDSEISESEQVIETEVDTNTIVEKTSNKNPNKLPKIGEK